MKYIIVVAVVALSLPAFAADNNLLETTDQARQRLSAENYDTYRQRGGDNQLLPPSYQQPLGSPSTYGVERPGYVSPYQSPSYSSDWRTRSKQ